MLKIEENWEPRDIEAPDRQDADTKMRNHKNPSWNSRTDVE